MTAEDVYRYATAPIRVLTTRLHQDLAAFAGIGWLPITLTVCSLWLASVYIASGFAIFTFFTIMAPIQLTAARYRHQVTEGPSEVPVFAWGIAGIIFWIGSTEAMVSTGDAVTVVRWLAGSLWFGSLAYWPDDDKGLPWLTKAWQTVKTAARPRATAPVGA